MIVLNNLTFVVTRSSEIIRSCGRRDLNSKAEEPCSVGDL